MSEIKKFDFNGREFKYSFNSFKYMEDLDFSCLDEKVLKKKPFKIVPLLETLVLGGVNYHTKIVIGIDEVQLYIENFIKEDGSISDLLTYLTDLLQESDFFKGLQKN